MARTFAIGVLAWMLWGWIGSQDHHATHVLEVGLQAADDDPIWEHAREQTAVIISKDEDFVDRWLVSDRPIPLVWIRNGNCSNQALLAWLEPLWPGTSIQSVCESGATLSP